MANLYIYASTYRYRYRYNIEFPFSQALSKESRKDLFCPKIVQANVQEIVMEEYNDAKEVFSSLATKKNKQSKGSCA